MKKALTILLAVLLVATVALTLTACSPCRKGLHEWDEDNAVITTPATCQEEGVKTVVCSRCGKSQTEVIQKGDHTYGELVAEVTPADCSHDGKAAHYQCSVCHKFFNEQKVEVTEADLTIPAKHDFGEWHEAVPSTSCKVQGTVGYKQCKSCKKYFDAEGKELESIYGEYGAHDFDVWHEAVAGDCQNKGTLGYKDCKVCGKHFDADGKELASTEGTFGAHVYGEWHDAVLGSDCKHTGTLGYQHCSVCDKNYDRDGNVLESLTGPIGAHNWDRQVEAVEPTCVASGNIAYNHCSACDKYYDEDGEELEEDEWILDATGVHDYADQDWTSDGAGHHYMDCTVCNSQGRKTEDCDLEWHREGDKHWQTCDLCTYESEHVAHNPEHGKCECGALYTEFDVTSFEDLEGLVPSEGITTEQKYFAIGTVKSVSNDYNASIYIVNEDGEELYVYGLFNEDGTIRYGKDAPTASSVISVGDVIVVYGVMTNFRGTIEMQYAWLVQVKDVAKTSLSALLLAETEIDSIVSADFDLPTADGKITWSVKSGSGITISDGYRAKVTRTEEDQPVVLTATANVDVTATKDYEVVVQLKLEGQELILLNADTLGFDSSSYGNNNGDHVVGGITFNTNQAYRRSNTTDIQGQKKNMVIKNTTAFPGRITKIEIVVSQGNFSLKLGETDTSLTTTKTFSATVTYEFNSNEVFYFFELTETNSATAYIQSIKIYYEQACDHEWQVDTAKGDEGWTWNVEDGEGTATLALKCALCGDTHEETVDVSYEEEAATCTQEGTGTYTANVKFENIDETATKEVELAKIAHSYQFTFDGEGHYNKCSVCNDIEGGAKTPHSLVYTMIDGNNHSADCEGCDYAIESAEHTWAETPTYVDAQQHETRCTATGCTAAKDRVDHSYTQDDGKCACGAEQDHEHNFNGDWAKDGENHWKECPTDKERDQQDSHTLVWEPTEDGQGHVYICSVCRYVKTTEDSHDYQGFAPVEGGEYHSATCSKCQKVNNQLAHRYNDEWTKNDGATHHQFCLDCNYEYTQAHTFASGDYVAIPDNATQHAKQCPICEEIDTANPVDCVLHWTFDNNNHHEECEDCDRITQDAPHSFTNKYTQKCECGAVNPEYLVVKKDGKNFALDFTQGILASDGSTNGYSGNSADYVRDGVTYTITNHNNNGRAWKLIKIGGKGATIKSTITTSTIASAVKTVTLTISNIVSKATCSITLTVKKGEEVVYTDTQSNVAAGTITFTVGTPTAGCTYEIAFDVDNTQTSTNGAVSLDKVELAALAETHEADLSKAINVTPATCEDNGSVTFTCTLSGCTETHTVSFPAVGHDYVKVDGQDAKCEEAGWQDHYKCSVCNKLFENENDTEEFDPTIEALNHNIVYRTNEQGQHQEYCDRLGCGYEGDWESHSSDNWIVGDEQHHKVCEVCGETFAQGNHSYTEPDNKCECGAQEGHQHTLDWAWNNEQHWKHCTQEGCEYVDESTRASHGNFENYRENDDEQHTVTCGTCNHDILQDHTKLYEDMEDDDQHMVYCSANCGWDELEDHNFVSFTPNDKGGHDAYCDVCEATVEQDHTFGDSGECACGEKEAPKEGSISFASTADRKSLNTTEQVWQANGITFTNTKGSSTSNVADYTNPIRIYAKSDIKVEFAGMKQIVFHCNSTTYADALKTSIGTVAGVTVTVSSKDVTITFDSARDSFEFTASAQLRFDSMDVKA